MNGNEIKEILISHLNLDEIIVTGDNSHFEVIVVSEIFNGISKIKQQQLVYAPLMKYFENKKIHALSIKTYTTAEWKKRLTIK